MRRRLANRDGEEEEEDDDAARDTEPTVKKPAGG